MEIRPGAASTPLPCWGDNCIRESGVAPCCCSGLLPFLGRGKRIRKRAWRRYRAIRMHRINFGLIVAELRETTPSILGESPRDGPQGLAEDARAILSELG